MKCAICGNKTDWNKSYGRETFIVCPTCHDRIAKAIKKFTNSKHYLPTALEVILEIGYIREEKNDEI